MKKSIIDTDFGVNVLYEPETKKDYEFLGGLTINEALMEGVFITVLSGVHWCLTVTLNSEGATDSMLARHGLTVNRG